MAINALTTTPRLTSDAATLSVVWAMFSGLSLAIVHAGASSWPWVDFADRVAIGAYGLVLLALLVAIGILRASSDVPRTRRRWGVVFMIGMSLGTAWSAYDGAQTALSALVGGAVGFGLATLLFIALGVGGRVRSKSVTRR